MTGASIHQWISKLAPYLEGRTTVGELTSALPPEKRDMVERIIAVLLERGLARDASSDLPELDAATRRAHRGETGYLDSFVADADRAYQCYRDAHIVIVGAGLICEELLGGLARSGASRLTALITSECHGEAERLRAAGKPTVPRVPAGRAADDVLGTLEQSADLVLHVSDCAMPRRALDLERACRQLDTPLVQAVRRGDDVWITAGGSWESAWRRLHGWDRDSADAFTDRPDAPAGLSGPAAAVTASMIGIAALRQLTGAADPTYAETMIRLPLPSLRTSTHHYLPHFATAPVTADTRSFLDTVDRLRAGPALQPEALDAAGAALLDERLGVLGEVSERDFVQLPLNVTAATVSSPPRLVTGAGLGVREARWRAVLNAVAAYAATAVDPWRLLPNGDGGLVRGYRLADGTARLLNTTDVFPAPDRQGPGVAVRYDWASAVSAGLLDCCAHRTAIWASGGGRFARLDPHAMRPDDEALAYLGMLDTLDVPHAVYDVTGPLRVPTLAFCVGSRTVAYVSALRPGDALADGLRAVILDEQSSRNAQPAYASAPVPQLQSITGGAAVGEPPAPRSEQQVITALTGLGYEPVAVPLDHDPELHKIVPHAVKVVIANS